jgi:hypothetical protein
VIGGVSNDIRSSTTIASGSLFVRESPPGKIRVTIMDIVSSFPRSDKKVWRGNADVVAQSVVSGFSNSTRGDRNRVDDTISAYLTPFHTPSDSNQLTIGV